MDKFQKVLSSFSISAEVIFNGDFCGGKTLGASGTIDKLGHMHFLKSGKLTLLSAQGHKLIFDQPSLIVLPFATEHQIIASETEAVEVLCAKIKFSAIEQQLIANLPKLICLPIDSGPMLQTVQWMFDEVDSTGLGQKSIVDKLCSILLIQMFRQLAEKGLVMQGMLAGLSHPALGETLALLQEMPEEQWTVESMADRAAMSRSKFAEVFRDTVGQTPNDFLTDLRVSIAQQLLKQDHPVSLIANKVGYEHGSALARVFRKKTGLSPKEWLQTIHKTGLN
jgi:AraC-like DNA-binding protein